MISGSSQQTPPKGGVFFGTLQVVVVQILISDTLIFVMSNILPFITTETSAVASYIEKINKSNFKDIEMSFDIEVSESEVIEHGFHFYQIPSNLWLTKDPTIKSLFKLLEEDCKQYVYGVYYVEQD